MKLNKKDITINSILHINNFPDLIKIEGKRSIFYLFNDRNRCGIYIYKFKNGDYYIGQSVDIAIRFLQHRKNYNDFEKITFRIVPLKDLSNIEQKIINKFELNDIFLRNITFSSIPKGASDFDMLFPKSVQNNWLNSYNILSSDRVRNIDYKMQRKYLKKFEKLTKYKIKKEFIDFLRNYFKYCIFEPHITERDFWRISCLPSDSETAITVLCRVNIYMQEVLSVYYDGKKQSIEITFHMAKSLLTKQAIFSKLVNNVQSINIQKNSHYYITGGADQLCLIAKNFKSANFIVSKPIYQKSIKLFNLRLMQKGVGFNKTSHCYDLSSLVLPK